MISTEKEYFTSVSKKMVPSNFSHIKQDRHILHIKSTLKHSIYYSSREKRTLQTPCVKFLTTHYGQKVLGEKTL